MILWLRRCLILVLELLGAAIAATLVLAALLAWRLTEGPLRLENLEPYLVAGLTELAAPYRISLNQTSITWGRDRTSLGLRASDVRIITPEGMLMATVPGVEIDLSVPALLLGRPAPKAVRLIGPQLRVLRTEAGDIRLTLAGSDVPPEGVGEDDLLQRWIQALQEEPNPASLLGALREVEITDAKMAVDDHQYRVRWMAPRADVTVRRDIDGVRGELALEIVAGNQLSTLSGTLLYERGRGDLRAQLKLDRFNPALLAQWSPSFAELKRINVPLRGQLAVRWVNPLGVAQVDFDLAAGKGELGLQADQAPVALEYAKLTGVFNRQQRSADITNLYLDFGGPTVQATANAVRQGNNILVVADAGIDNMKAAELQRYWLPFIARGARRWVTHNIVTGEVPKANAQVRLTIPLEDPQHPVVTALGGGMVLQGISVHYFRPLPPVTGARGIARFDKDVFRIDVEAGRVGAIRVPRATVQLLGLHDDSDRADIELTATGRLSDQLRLLDNEPLHYARRLNIKADQAQGQATTRARFQFPLFGDLPIEQVAIAAASRITGAGIPGIVAGNDLKDGQLDLVLDGGGMKISGTGRVGGAAATFSWTESFVRDVSPGTEISFSGSMDEAARRAFHVSWPDVLGGSVDVTGTYLKDRAQPGVLRTELDFAKATLALPWFGWHKSVGEAGKGSAAVVIEQGQVEAVNAFSLEAPGARLRGRVEFDPGSRWRRVVLDRLSAPGSDLSGEVINQRDNGLALTLKGSAVDVRGIFEEAELATPRAAPDVEASAAELMPIDIKFDFRRAVTGDGRLLSDAKGRLVRNNRGWTQLEIAGRLNGGTPMRVSLVPNATGRALTIESQDAGALLTTLRLTENIHGGTISVTGQGEGQGPVRAVADMRNFRYLNAKTLQRIAAVAEPKGAEALAREEGIPFTRLKARFDYAEDHIQVREARMSGDLVGLTLAGRVDLREAQLDLSGTFVPVYGLNSAVSGIPIIGWLLTGGEGGGIFAAAYTVRGPLKDPQTSVNPLSILTPGFLRELFFVDNK